MSMENLHQKKQHGVCRKLRNDQKRGGTRTKPQCSWQGKVGAGSPRRGAPDVSTDPSPKNSALKRRPEIGEMLVEKMQGHGNKCGRDLSAFQRPCIPPEVKQSDPTTPCKSTPT